MNQRKDSKTIFYKLRVQQVNRMKSRLYRQGIATVLAGVCGSHLVANGVLALQLEEVVVTAQKREQSLRDVPISVSAMSGEKINDEGILNLEELSLFMPNVSINKGATQPNLYIRGIGSGSNAGFEQSVGLYIDGIYSGRAQLASVPLTLDLERVEVLKGPQGILFGKNTIGGAINITTARPDFEFDAYVEALYAPEDGEQVYTGVVSGSLSEAVAGRLAVRYEGMDGWWKNTTLREEGPDKENLFVRASALWDASDSIEVLAKYEDGDFESSNLPFVVYQSDQPTNFLNEQPFPVIDDSDRGAMNNPMTDDTDTQTAVVTLNWLLPAATFTSISGYASYQSQRQLDADIGASAGLFRILDEDYEQFSQELRLVSPGGDTLDWIVGAYFQTSELDASTTLVELDFARAGDLAVPALVNTAAEPLAPSLFDQESSSWAVFAQGTYSVTDTLRFGLGLRYNEEKKDLDKAVFGASTVGARAADNGPGADLIVFARPDDRALITDLRSHSFDGLSRSEEQATWAVSAQWDVTAESMLYASISTGFKGGGYDEAYTGSGPLIRTGDTLTGTPDGGVIETGIDGSILEFEDESVLAYELGAKLGLADGAAELNLAAFRMEFDNLQVSSLVGDVFRVGNAGEAVVQGLEVDGRWLLAEGLTLAGSLAYLDASYDTFVGATCTIPQVSDPDNNPGCLRPDGSNIVVGEEGGQDLGGETLSYAPEWSANIGLEWVRPIGDSLEIRTSADVNYTDEFYSSLDLDPNTLHDSATRVNARIALAPADDSWSVAIVGKNLTDERTSVFNNDVPTTNSNSYYAVPERPRSIALQARYRF